MKFETKFGLGEITAYEVYKNDELVGDALLEVVGISIDMEKQITYACRYPESGVTALFTESQLIGDPDFNQETGSY